MHQLDTQSSWIFIYIYIYISVYCTIINSFCLWRHTQKKKKPLKLYLLLNYNISDNHRVGQGKKIKKKKKPHLSAGHFFSPSRSVVFPCFFQRLPCAKWRKLQAAPRFCALFLLCCERGLKILGIGQFISAWGWETRALPLLAEVQNLVGIA